MTTTALFLLLGTVAYLLAATVGSDVLRSILQAVGTFLIGTVVIGYAYQYFLSEEIEDRMVAKLDEVLEHRIDRLIPEASRYGFAGFVQAAPRRAFEALGPGSELLWLDTYSPDLPLFGAQLRQAVERGARVRMLVIDPEAGTTRMRAEEIVEPGYDPSKFCGEARAFLAYLADAAEDLADAPGSLEIRCYDDLPCVPMYLHLRDGKPASGITGFFLTDPSFDQAHLSWTAATGGTLTSFVAYFEHKWSGLAQYDRRPAETSLDQR